VTPQGPPEAGGAQQCVLKSGTTARDGFSAAVTPESAGWGYSGLLVLDLEQGASHTMTFAGAEALLLPLTGGLEVEVADEHLVLAGRPDVFGGPSDFVYLPRGSTVTVTATAPAARVSIATARAERVLPLRYGSSSEVRVDLRGAGSCSRQVNNYTLGTDIEVDHLLVCEVVTPGGNWSSYPPHKHDRHAADERELEEIYYFAVQPGPRGPGIAYHRVYGTQGREIDILEEVHDGDIVLVPHGFHGPSMAAPGYDLYYLNVMAGPATDRRWLAVDDPAHQWVRETWTHQKIDPRLPVGNRNEDRS